MSFLLRERVCWFKLSWLLLEGDLSKLLMSCTNFNQERGYKSNPTITIVTFFSEEKANKKHNRSILQTVS